MSKKILFFDVDGTLTNDDKVITPKTREALIQVQRDGHTVALASGRPDPGMKFLADELELDKYNGYVLAFNGGKVINWTTKKIVFQQTMSREYVKPLLDFVTENDLGLITYDDKQVIVGTRMDEFIENEGFINRIPLKQCDMLKYPTTDLNKCLATAPPDIAEKYEMMLAEAFKGKLSVYRSAPYFIEIVPQGIDKATSIDKLIKYLGIEQKDSIAFGDGFNDVSMIKYAGLGVAMGNGQDVVKEIANIVAPSNNEDGIATIISRLYENKIL